MPPCQNTVIYFMSYNEKIEKKKHFYSKVTRGPCILSGEWCLHVQSLAIVRKLRRYTAST